ncbi:Mrp/NBP35 family ATP-binding protein [Pelagicoccus sp. NFK12]|uniref:Iron-sulfur cluster carrier protein n=1 Tax=Pelagicoccus enzymogenes TaxID=2773457 RepID=A0A927IGE3_9BACT|nr:Mrp/NBP35 family ATP-binding protein [Pelagicoccus enzymogenes]MBD5779071.1 Mrp/NBP35 family ATP-binding protein [Pelagicoccus enzymogenes]MDQ8200205.1 Mrp/NBP35 family ATP-binding protein [Pelagicoccus enzymogenes]
MSLEKINQALATVKYPGFSRDIVSFGIVRSVDFQDGKASVSIAITTSDNSIPPAIRDSVEAALNALPEVNEVDVSIVLSASKKASQSNGAAPAEGIPGVKHVIAVSSGKGGVGKSTFAVNLACAFSQILEAEGKKAGIMDCDIYGPSVPLMLGLSGRPYVEGDSLIPMEGHNLSVMSMGFLVDEDTPVVWRGPMVMKTIQQFSQNVKWGDLELLVVDLPPGTGDAQLSLVQTIPLSGAVLVTTPQPAATQVAKRGARMLEKTNVKILGVAENMSYLEGPDGSRQNIFGEGGGPQTASDLKTDFLGQIPLDQSIREGGDAGTPIVLSKPDSQAAKVFKEIANTLLAKVRS